MSFSSTPLGQARRLDHQTFFKGTTLTYDKPKSQTSASGRAANISTVPLSYAYGAPTRNPDSPSKSLEDPSRSHSAYQATTEQRQEQEEDDSLLSRYAQLKQRNQALANRPGSALGPGIITNPPQPTAASSKDTSVIIASAFQLAASSHNMPPTSQWNAGQRAGVPRSTSVEYEQETQQTSHRRLAVPPSRTGGRSSRPPSKVGSTTRDYDVDEPVDANGRGKSPFDHLADLTRRAMSPATFLMRQRSQEPEDIRAPSRLNTETTLVAPHNNSESYDYHEEEEEYQQMQRASKRPSAAHKRGRISIDNKAYRPSQSDLESESESDADGERKGRRRKSKKKDSGGGPLTTLPITHYDKKRKKKGKIGDNSLEDDASASDEHVSEQALASTSRQSAPPRSRNAIPSERNSYETSGPTDESFDIEQGLDSIPEADELNLESDDSGVRTKHIPIQFSREDISLESSSQPAFSIGRFLGTIVHTGYRLGRAIFSLLFNLILQIALLIGRILGTILDALIRRPARAFARNPASFFTYIFQPLLAVLVMYIGYTILRNPDLINIPSFPQPTTRYEHVDLPPGTIEEFATRLLKMENSMASRSKQEGPVSRAFEKRLDDILHRMETLDRKIDRVSKASGSQRTEEELKKDLERIRRDFRSLQSRADEVEQTAKATNHDALIAKWDALEERVGAVEGGVKEAIELGQSVAKAGSIATSISSPSWWDKLVAGDSPAITIKTADGQDLSSVVVHIVDKALSYHRKDDVARVDYAQNSGGASIIPSLTSQTLEVTQPSFFGLFAGRPTYARSPLTALHHETHLGYCWPFAGPKGQLGVKLSAPVRISDFTIDHVAAENAHDLRNAPRHMEVWGLIEGHDNVEKYQEYRKNMAEQRLHANETGVVVPDEPIPPHGWASVPSMRIASFTYDIRASDNIQTFPVPEDIRNLDIDFALVVLTVKSNWGNDEFTCLYRFRVHGTRIEPVPEPDP